MQQPAPSLGAAPPSAPRFSRRQSYGPASSLYLDSLPSFSSASVSAGQRSVPSIEHYAHPTFPDSSTEAQSPGGTLFVAGRPVDVGSLGEQPWRIWRDEDALPAAKTPSVIGTPAVTSSGTPSWPSSQQPRTPAAWPSDAQGPILSPSTRKPASSASEIDASSYDYFNIPQQRLSSLQFDLPSQDNNADLERRRANLNPSLSRTPEEAQHVINNSSSLAPHVSALTPLRYPDPATSRLAFTSALDSSSPAAMSFPGKPPMNRGISFPLDPRAYSMTKNADEGADPVDEITDSMRNLGTSSVLPSPAEVPSSFALPQSDIAASSPLPTPQIPSSAAVSNSITPSASPVPQRSSTASAANNDRGISHNGNYKQHKSQNSRSRSNPNTETQFSRRQNGSRTDYDPNKASANNLNRPSGLPAYPYEFSGAHHMTGPLIDIYHQHQQQDPLTAMSLGGSSQVMYASHGRTSPLGQHQAAQNMWRLAPMPYSSGLPGDYSLAGTPPQRPAHLPQGVTSPTLPQYDLPRPEYSASADITQPGTPNSRRTTMSSHISPPQLIDPIRQSPWGHVVSLPQQTRVSLPSVASVPSVPIIDYSSALPPIWPAPGQEGSPYVPYGNSPTANQTRRSDDRRARNSFIDEFRHGRHKSLELADIRGHLSEVAGDQEGSRHIQAKLETATSEQKQQVFEEILPNIIRLSTDLFANYVVQKFIDLADKSQRARLAKALEGHVLRLSLQMYGCRVVQKALEKMDLDQQIAMANELRDNILKCAHDQNANHVLQRCMERIPSKHLQFVVDACKDNVLTLGTHPYGCRVLQRVFENCPAPQARPLLDELHHYSLPLIKDNFGNYVVQYIIENGIREDCVRLVKGIHGSILTLSRQKFSSNVVESCIRMADPDDLWKFTQEILEPRPDGNCAIGIMMRDQYANYPLQKFLKYVQDENQRQQLYTTVARQLAIIRQASSPGFTSRHLSVCKLYPILEDLVKKAGFIVEAS